MLGAHVDNRLLLLFRQGTYRQRYAEQLVRPQSRVVARAWHVDHIEAAAAVLIPKFLKIFSGL